MMTLTQAIQWADAHAGVAFVIATGIVNGWGAVKVSWQKFVGRPMPRNWLTIALDMLVELAPNFLGAVDRANRLRGKPSMFQATGAATPVSQIAADPDARATTVPTETP